MSSSPISSSAPAEWKNWQKAVFRTAAIFLVLLALPWDGRFWSALFSGEWGSFQTFFRLTAYGASFIPEADLPKWGIGSYANWAIAFILALAGGFVWGRYDRGRTDYNQAYYWLRVLLRYRLAVGIIGAGIIMLFPLQFPKPTLSELHTAYGEFLPWKAYYLTNGVGVAYFQETLGLLEIVGGVLLLWRKTVAVGAGLVAAILANVVPANFAYQIGDHVYASYLLLLALVLLAHDVPRLYNLLVVERFAKADHFQPNLDRRGLGRLRRGARTALAVFFAAFGVVAYADYSGSRWPFPEKAGLEGLAGYYNVREFEIDGRVLPYSPSDPVRWQNVVFEEWNTASVRIHRPVTLRPLNTQFTDPGENLRAYEHAGNGGRHFFRYEADAGGVKLAFTGRNDPRETYAFSLERVGDSTLVLTGRDGNDAALRIVLDRLDRRYLLKEGRRKPITL